MSWVQFSNRNDSCSESRKNFLVILKIVEPLNNWAILLIKQLKRILFFVCVIFVKYLCVNHKVAFNGNCMNFSSYSSTNPILAEKNS